MSLRLFTQRSQHLTPKRINSQTQLFTNKYRIHIYTLLVRLEENTNMVKQHMIYARIGSMAVAFEAYVCAFVCGQISRRYYYLYDASAEAVGKWRRR